MSKQRVICVVGPTASGKTLLAARLAGLVGGEVISADSVQVYRGFDIGSGKPSPEELALAPTHLIDIADPLQPIEAHVWARMAEEQIATIAARGALPIVCGGTFLWVRALLYGLAEAPAGDEEVRARHQRLAEEHGRAHLHALLAQVDPKSAARLHPNDLLRVSRALEVYELSGRTMSEVQEAHGFRERRYDATLVTVDFPRAAYELRLAARISQMVADGLVDEVRALFAAGYADSRAMGSVGYRQVKEALQTGEPVDEGALVQSIIQVSRVFARRQRTWLRDEEAVLAPLACLSDAEALRDLARRLGLARE